MGELNLRDKKGAAHVHVSWPDNFWQRAWADPWTRALWAFSTLMVVAYVGLAIYEVLF